MLPWIYEVEPESTFPEMELMLRKFAWKLTAKTGLSHEEAFSEMYCCFLTACANFKPEKGVKFSTYCHFILSMGVKEYLRSKYTTNEVALEENQSAVRFVAPHRITVLEILEDLSKDAKEIALLILESPKELHWLGEATTVYRFMVKVREFLRERKDFTNERISLGMDELREKLNEAWAS